MKAVYKRQLTIFATIAFLFVCGGIVALFFGVRMYWESATFAERANEASGTVVDYEKIVRGTGSNERKDVRYYVIVEFTVADGRRYRFQGPHRQEEGPFKISKGDVVSVLYDPADPQNAKVNSFLGMWFASTILIVVGIAFILVPMLTLWTSWKWVNNQKT
jgi:nitrogen fixation-related uncharacterized protein